MSLITVSTFCQTFEHQFDEDFGRVYQISENEYVYGVLDNLHKQFFIYSMDYNLLKTIDLVPDSASSFSIFNVSKTLFNTDDKFEVCYGWWTIGYGLKVINEDDNVILSEDGSMGAEFFNTNVGAKMIVSFYSINKLKVYGLVGTVLTSGKYLVNSNDMNLYPNPSSNKITIELGSNSKQQNCLISIYSVDGKLIKNINVSQDQQRISINISDLLPGIYFYNIHSNNNSTSMNKFIVSRYNKLTHHNKPA
jgi:hypothetical protein